MKLGEIYEPRRELRRRKKRSEKRREKRRKAQWAQNSMVVFIKIQLNLTKLLTINHSNMVNFKLEQEFVKDVVDLCVKYSETFHCAVENTKTKKKGKKLLHLVKESQTSEAAQKAVIYDSISIENVNSSQLRLLAAAAVAKHA